MRPRPGPSLTACPSAPGDASRPGAEHRGLGPRPPERVRESRGLRRERRRTEVREQLRAAHEVLTEMGMQVFADRARRELAATGETARTCIQPPRTLGEMAPEPLNPPGSASRAAGHRPLRIHTFDRERTVA